MVLCAQMIDEEANWHESLEQLLKLQRAGCLFRFVLLKVFIAWNNLEIIPYSLLKRTNVIRIGPLTYFLFWRTWISSIGMGRTMV